MISLIRHNISLLASAFIVLAGIAVAAYGLVHFFGSLAIYFAINSSPIAEMQGFKPLAALMIVAQHGVTGLAGLALAWFGGSSFVRTWRAGPPADETVVAGSVLGRSLGLLIYGASALYGSYGIIFGMGPLLDDYQLAIHGEKTTARIIQVEPATDIAWDVQRVTYVFTARNGQSVHGTWNSFSYPVRQAQERGWVEVTYNSQNPQHSRVEFEFSTQFALGFFGGQLLFVVIGIWGFAKNASAMAERSPPDPETRLQPPPPRPASMPQQGTGRRAQFGRRGL